MTPHPGAQGGTWEVVGFEGLVLDVSARRRATAVSFVVALVILGLSLNLAKRAFPRSTGL